MRTFKALVGLFIVAFCVDAALWHGYYRERYGAHLHSAAQRVSGLNWYGMGDD
jgi:hypothetical protein